MAKRMEPDEGFDSGNYSQDIPPKTVPLDLSRGSRDNNVSSSSSSSRQHSEDPHQSFGQQNSAIRIEDSSQSHALTSYPTDGAEKPEFRIQVQADSYPSSQRGSPIALAGQQVVSNQIPVSLQYPFHRNTILAAPSASSANNFGRELPRDQHNSDFNNVAESMAQLPNRHLIQNVDNTFMLSVNGQMLQSQLSQSPRLGLSSPYDNTQDQLLLSSPLATFPVMPPVSSIINRKRRNEVREKKDNSKSASGTVASAETSSSSSREAGEDPDAKKAKAVPEDQKDEAYWERRRKNNEAAKRSRDARRQKEEEIASRANFLEQENLKLRAEIHVLKSETAKLHYMIFQTRM
ncbi:uncharacterized protein LOC143281694 [Babylonia areolata]|uniref:uncharacterized protein LOC143281694 n=1 Tax=Babylonia areolata TaxID=304850 RepID=UPI003FD3C48F